MGDGAVSQPGLRPMHYVRGREPKTKIPASGDALAMPGRDTDGRRRSTGAAVDHAHLASAGALRLCPHRPAKSWYFAKGTCGLWLCGYRS